MFKNRLLALQLQIHTRINSVKYTKIYLCFFSLPPCLTKKVFIPFAINKSRSVLLIAIYDLFDVFPV